MGGLGNPFIVLKTEIASDSQLEMLSEEALNQGTQACLMNAAGFRLRNERISNNVIVLSTISKEGGSTRIKISDLYGKG